MTDSLPPKKLLYSHFIYYTYSAFSTKSYHSLFLYHCTTIHHFNFHFLSNQPLLNYSVQCVCSNITNYNTITINLHVLLLRIRIHADSRAGYIRSTFFITSYSYFHITRCSMNTWNYYYSMFVPSFSAVVISLSVES